MSTAAHPTAAEPRAPGARGARSLDLVRLRSRLPLASLLSLTALLYLWGLGRNGTANAYYAAAVQAGTESWKAFLFGSLDAGNYITVDKPPASLWLMELSTRVFGFSSWAMLVPQALAGVASVWLLVATVRRWFSTRAALLAGLLLAVTPVAALMFRFNNPDALLVLLFVAATYATVRAIERRPLLWLPLAGTAVGLAFLTKMLQGLLIVPALALAYLVAAPAPLARRIGHLLAGAAAMVAAAGWWLAVVALTPASERPYVGGSTDDSIFDLVWGYNGLGRISGGGNGPGGGFAGEPGALRLFNDLMGGQIAWLLPASGLLLAVGLWATRRAPRTDRTRAAVILAGGSLLVPAATYSLMTGTIHPYYTNTLAAPAAAIVGAGGVALWERRTSLAARVALAVAVASTATTAVLLLDRTPSWHPWLRTVVAASGLAGAVGVLAAARLGRWALAAVAAASVVAVATGPLAYTLETVSTGQRGSTVAAGPATAGGTVGAGGMRPDGGTGGPGGGMPPSGTGAAPSGSGTTPPSGETAPPGNGSGPGGVAGSGATPSAGGASTPSAELAAALTEEDDAGATWLAATASANGAAELQLATGRPVMALGGFTGSDPAITLAEFKALVAAGRIHWFVAGGGRGGGPGGGGAATEIAEWVASAFTARTIDGTTVYDLTA